MAVPIGSQAHWWLLNSFSTPFTDSKKEHMVLRNYNIFVCYCWMVSDKN